MKRSGALFSRIDQADTLNVFGTPSSGNSSLHRRNKTEFNNQNTSNNSINSTGENVSLDSATPTSRIGTLIRSHSIPSLKFGNEDKQSRSKSSLPRSTRQVERSPITHFCTPRRSGGHSQLNDFSKMKDTRSFGKNVSGQQNKTPLKRFFSEANLHKPPVTPDCFNMVHMETPKNKCDPEVHPDEETSNLTVCVRVRPLNLREQNDPAISNVVNVEGNEIKVICESGTSHTFTYDHCFWSCDPQHPQFASQDAVFTSMVQPLIDKTFLGYNACLFAYGQTGSGKSYSMMGVDLDDGISMGKNIGIIPRFCHELFERIDSLEDYVDAEKATTNNVNVEISYFEIYNEKIHDLLGGSSDGRKRAPLKVREHPVFGPYVVDLSVHGVTSYDDLQGWLTVGNSQRATAATGMNEKSSRSHSIFSIVLTQTQEENVEGECHKHCRRSKINLVDLAGSERLSHTCASGDRLREGVSINRSLLTLGKVIAALADNGNSKKKSFVPYRESVLTWLLRESLGGNSTTTMLATISPANIHVDETLATLRYACQARTIVNRVRVNEDPHDRLIRELRSEVERLRSLREDYERQIKLGVPRRLLQNEELNLGDKELEIESLKEQLKQSEEQLRQSEEQLEVAQRSWSERLEEAERHKSVELNHLRRCGIAVQLEWKQQHPCLVNLAADPSLSGTLFYLLPTGSVQIGQLDATLGEQAQPDIALSGPLVQPHHCTIMNQESQLTLIPGSSGETFVNGEIVKDKVRLQHGDRLIIARSHYFRISNPYDCGVKTDKLVDYNSAHQEILRIQEEKLLAELDEAKRQAVQEAKMEAEKQLGCQRLNYENQLQQMEATLDQYKHALDEIQKRKDELEKQKKTLEDVVQRKCAIEKTVPDLSVLPYRSNLLEELEAALNETVAESESIMTLDSSTLSDNLNTTNLYELSASIQEANQLCKDLGISFEFTIFHIIGENGMEPKVRVRDTKKHLKTLWKSEYFLKWFTHLQDFDQNDSLKELLDTDMEWEVDEDVKQGNQSGNSVSVNINQVKKLNDSFQQLSVDASCCNDSALENSSIGLLDNTFITDDKLDVENVNNCLLELERSTKKLVQLCKNLRNQDDINTNIDSLHTIIQQLKSSFRTRKNISEESSCLEVGTSNFSCFSTNRFPERSNLRSQFTIKSTTQTQKAVRFFFPDSQQ